MELFRGSVLRYLLLFAALSIHGVTAQPPDHPIITEIFDDPTGNDGPTGRTAGNLHQEFIEIFLPTAANLKPSLNKDALRLTFYELEGDSGNSERGFVNQRFDLPTFDLDSSNGITLGAVPRPSSGVVVLGWVDYNASVTGLAGTASTRIGLINGGITSSPAGTLFVAMNGAQFGGTTNFPVPTAESKIDIPDENMLGILANGSNVYLLVNRDSPGYAVLQDRAHPELGPANANLPLGSTLGFSCLMDGIAGNDDSKFNTLSQPYVSPTGLNIDLEDVLPAGGVFSNWVAQIPELSGGGYARRFVDQLRTTEDATAGNENPAGDAQTHYRQVYETGPFFPTPGSVTYSTDPPQFAVAQSTRYSFNVIAGTTGRPGLITANIGGNFPINVTATPGASSNPAIATFAPSFDETGILGQLDAFPQVEVSVPLAASQAATASATINFAATNAINGDPAVLNPNQNSSATVTVLKPTRGLDAFSAPIETTVFLAVQGFGSNVLVLNELLGTDLAAFISANLGQSVQETLGHIHILLNTGTNLEDNTTMTSMRISFPSTEAGYINRPGPPGKDDLVNTVLHSAEVVGGGSAYAGSFNVTQTALKAIELAIPETRTKNGAFAASEYLFFAEPSGDIYNRRSGLSWVTTSRTFEVALLDTNTTSTGLESGDADDFGIIVQVGRVRSGASVVPGQFVFLSYSGGTQGEDIDTLDLPGPQATEAILLDLDNLDDILGCQTITRIFVVDGDGSGAVDIVEALSLSADQPTGPTCGNGICFLPETPCNCPADCGQPAASEFVCNDGLDNDCDQLTDCADSDCIQSVSCVGPDCGNGSCVFPETACSCPADCAPPGAPPTPMPDPSGLDKCRFISFSLSDAGQCTALRVKLASLHHVVPPYTGGASIPFTAFEGLSVWVGPPSSYVESAATGTPFKSAATQCTPFYHDWNTEGLVHVRGSAIVPSSTYQVENVAASCQGDEESVACVTGGSSVSGPLEIKTTRWGDLETPFNPPSTTTQPAFGDVSALIDKFKDVIGAPMKARAIIAPGDAFGNVTNATMSVNVGFTHIAACVDAFKGQPYPAKMGKCSGTGTVSCTTASDCNSGGNTGPCNLYCP